MAIDLTTWRAQRQSQLTLPSGLVVTVRRVDLIDLAAQGQIPTPLLDQIQAHLTDNAGRFQIADLALLGELPTIIARAAIIDPPLAETGDATHLGLDELPMQDKLAILTWAQQGVAPLATFPGDASRANPPVARGRQRVPPATKHAPDGDVAGLSDRSGGIVANQPEDSPRARRSTT